METATCTVVYLSAKGLKLHWCQCTLASFKRGMAQSIPTTLVYVEQTVVHGRTSAMIKALNLNVKAYILSSQSS